MSNSRPTRRLHAAVRAAEGGPGITARYRWTQSRFLRSRCPESRTTGGSLSGRVALPALVVRPRRNPSTATRPWAEGKEAYRPLACPWSPHFLRRSCRSRRRSCLVLRLAGTVFSLHPWRLDRDEAGAIADAPEAMSASFRRPRPAVRGLLPRSHRWLLTHDPNSVLQRRRASARR